MPSLAGSLERLAEGVVFEGAESLVTLLHPRPNLLPDFFPARRGRARRPDAVARTRRPRSARRPRSSPTWRLGGARREPPVRRGRVRVRREGARPRARPALSTCPPSATTASPGSRGTRSRATSKPSPRVPKAARRRLPRRADHGRARPGQAPARRPRRTDGAGPASTRRSRPTASGPGSRSPRPAAPRVPARRARPGRHRRVGPVRPPPDAAAPRRMGARTSAADAVLELEPRATRSSTAPTGSGSTAGWSPARSPGPSTANRVTRDYVQLEYANGDTLYVPSDQVDAIARYQGGETPAPMRLGGAQWEKAKNRVRSAVRDIAAELIRLYAARMHAPGNAVQPRRDDAARARGRLPHVETEDQLTVVDEIKRDLETPLPMDRVLAGDVGFGKTEVAVRAAAKVVFDGKQVAVLVPTTILAQQHFETFRERFAGSPSRSGCCRGSSPTPRSATRSTASPPAPSTSSSAPTRCSVKGRGVEGPRPGRHRRGAALRRVPEGAPQAAAHVRGRAVDVRDPDPADPRDGGVRGSATCRSSRPRPRTASRSSPSCRSTTRARSRWRSAASCCATGRSSTCTTRSTRSTPVAEYLQELVPDARSRSPTGRWTSARSNTSWSGSGSASSTSSCARPSSSPASTSRTPTP
jgi:outer membrane murein-binding lipoprotein Lpp